MLRLIKLTAILGFTLMAAFSCTGNPPENTVEKTAGAEPLHEVLSPWANVDPVQVRGISPRLDSLQGKKIGLFANFKRAAVPIANEVEKRLKERFPDIETVLFHSTLPNVDESETVNKDNFASWAKGVDAVVGMVGD
ncbi:MAG: hypothetical protein JXL81_03535 [Deltaproteobacteria bacterium]|nr:hypothetical protein [Deltaproteobacteria bacterium]